MPAISKDAGLSQFCPLTVYGLGTIRRQLLLYVQQTAEYIHCMPFSSKSQATIFAILDDFARFRYNEESYRTLMQLRDHI